MEKEKETKHKSLSIEEIKAFLKEVRESPRPTKRTLGVSREALAAFEEAIQLDKNKWFKDNLE